MIESRVSAVCENIAAKLSGRPASAQATWNAICLAHFGDAGAAAFLALLAIPPRTLT
jgi:sulfide:quinone oxidoreductase